MENVVIFPMDTGRFRTSQISEGMTYEVHGELVNRPQESTTSATSEPNTPFGSYTAPVLPRHSNSAKVPQQMYRATKKTFRKAVSLVSLTSTVPMRASTSKASRLEYTIVTQIYLCLTAEQCNVTSVCDLVAEQVGFPVILLDSKCYPLSANAGTCGVDFWKTSRKILAASKSLYVQLSGSDDPAPDAETAPQAKKPWQETLVLEKIAALEKKVSVPVEMSKAMQCSICQGIASPPVVSSCCQSSCEGWHHCVCTGIGLHFLRTTTFAAAKRVVK